MGKKTNEQFILELESINKNIIPLDEYNGANKSIKFKCKIDCHEWNNSPSHILSGQGCPKCAGLVNKTHEQFINELFLINENIKVLDRYLSGTKHITCKCLLDGHVWKVRPNNLLNKKGCPKCAGNIQKTHDEFIKEMKAINTDIEILGTYINCKTEILCRCKVDGHTWITIPNRILGGGGCPKCNNNYTRTHDEFIEDIKIINPNIQIIEQYINTNSKIRTRCLIDGYEWNVDPSSLLGGKGCPKCGGRLQITHEEFIEKMKTINEDIIILGKYINNKSKIKVKCKKDNYEWSPTANSLSTGKGCPICKESIGEKTISSFLKNKEINFQREYKFEDCRSKNNRKMPFDFYIPSINVCIEYDGIQHFKPIKYFGGIKKFNNIKERDLMKNNYCINNNINLIRIPYHIKDIGKYLDIELNKLFKIRDQQQNQIAV